MKNIKLSEIADITTGYIEHKSRKLFESKNIPIIQLRDLSTNGKINYKNINTQEISVNDRYPQLNVGDVIFSAKGSKRSAGVIDRDIKDITASNHYLIIKIRDQNNCKLLPEFLALYLRQKTAMDYFNLHGTGTYIPFISAAVLKEMPVLFPDVEKQRKITDLEGFINKEKELIENLNELKNSMYKGILEKILS